MYRVHIQDVGWQEWKADGEIAGLAGKNKRVEAIQIKLVKKEKKVRLFIESNVKVPGLKNIRDEILQYKTKINTNNENLDTLNKRLDTQIEKIRTIAKLREEAEQFGINK